MFQFNLFSFLLLFLWLSFSFPTIFTNLNLNNLKQNMILINFHQIIAPYTKYILLKKNPQTDLLSVYYWFSIICSWIIFSLVKYGCVY